MANPLLDPMWLIVVEAHTVGEPPHTVYAVPRTEFRMGGRDDDQGSRVRYLKMRALLWAQADAGVPPWKPYLRAGWSSVRAEPIKVYA